MIGCVFISDHSSSVSCVGLRRMCSGMPIFPMSWKSAPRFTAAISSGPSPSERATASAWCMVAWEWPCV